MIEQRAEVRFDGQEELDGRLRYDYSGNLFYSQYKPLFDKLYYLVGTQRDEAKLQEYRKEFKELLRIEKDYREEHMYRPELEEFSFRIGQLTRTAQSLERVLDKEKQQGQRLLELLHVMEEAKNSKDTACDFQRQLKVCAEWERSAEQSNKQMTQLEEEVGRTQKQLQPSFQKVSRLIEQEIQKKKEQQEGSQAQIDRLEQMRRELEACNKRSEKEVQDIQNARKLKGKKELTRKQIAYEEQLQSIVVSRPEPLKYGNVTFVPSVPKSKDAQRFSLYIVASVVATYVLLLIVGFV